MSVFSFVVDGDAVAAVEISDAEKARILAAYATVPGYDSVVDGEETRPLTETEMWRAIAGGWLAGTLANVRRIEEEVAKAAVVVPAAIVPTPLSPD